MALVRFLMAFSRHGGSLSSSISGEERSGGFPVPFALSVDSRVALHGLGLSLTSKRYRMECKLVDSKELETMDFIIGEIVQVYCEERSLSDNKPDYEKIDPLLFFMPEGPYLKTGNVIAKAFEVGRDLKLLKKTSRRRE